MNLMYTLAQVIQYFFPLIALVHLIIGIKRKAIQYVISALWISLIAVLIHFQFSGNQIFSTYFDYTNAAIYSFTLVVLVISLIRIILHLSSGHSIFNYVATFINAMVVVGAFLVVINVWINALFIENKKPGTPVMQVALFQKPSYCGYKYVFYKVMPDDTVMYLCPNYYGLVASVGHLSTSPSFVTTQLHSLSTNAAKPEKSK